LAEREGALSASGALTALTRLVQRRPEQRWWLEKALSGRLEHLADIALQVAVETGDPIGSVLAKLIEREESIDLVESILTRFDESSYRDSVALFDTVLVSTRRVLSYRRELTAAQDEERFAEIARLSNNLSFSFSRSGRQEEAREAAQSAVKVFRSLSSGGPEREYELAASLSNLGVVESNLGNYQSAIMATEEAVRISRGLSEKWPIEMTPDLAQNLINLGSISFSSGYGEKALTATTEAVEILQRLAGEHPGAFSANLARSLNNLGAILRSLGRFDEALEVASRGLALRRALAEVNPGIFSADLAASLQNVAIAIREQAGRKEEALTTIQEAVAIRRRIAAQRLEAALPDLADSLEDLAATLLETRERGIEALAVIQEAVAIRRQIVASGPVVSTLLDLVDSLVTLAASHLEVGEREPAFRILMESIEILQGAKTQQLAEAAVRLRAVLERLTAALEEPDSTGDPTMRIASLEQVVRSVTLFFHRQPLIFADPMNTALLTYLATLLRVGREPDRELLRSIIQVAEKEILGGPL
jgi:tetratricopeptide (TPR) repeat protein